MNRVALNVDKSGSSSGSSHRVEGLHTQYLIQKGPCRVRPPLARAGEPHAKAARLCCLRCADVPF